MLFLFWPSPPVKGVQNWWYLPGADRNYQVSFTQREREVCIREEKVFKALAKGLGRAQKRFQICKLAGLELHWTAYCIFAVGTQVDLNASLLVQDRCLASRFVRCNTLMFGVEVPNIAHIPTPIPWPPAPDPQRVTLGETARRPRRTGPAAFVSRWHQTAKKNWSKQKEGMSPSNAVFVRKYGTPNSVGNYQWTLSTVGPQPEARTGWSPTGWLKYELQWFKSVHSLMEWCCPINLIDNRVPIIQKHLETTITSTININEPVTDGLRLRNLERRWPFPTELSTYKVQRNLSAIWTWMPGWHFKKI